jgi:hypothetical protein
MSAADVRTAKSAIFQPHYMKAIEAEYYARNELRMSRGMTSEPIATVAYWNALKDEVGNELIPFYAVIGKSYVYFIYALITLCVLGSVVGFFFRLTKEWNANGCTPRLGITLCQGVYHVVMVPIDFVKAGYNGVVDHQEGDGPSLSYLENLVNHLRTEFISLTATVLTLREQLAPYLVAGKASSPPPPYFGNNGHPPPPPARQDSLDGPAHLRQLSNLDLPDIAALFGEEAAANTRRRSKDPSRGPSAPPIITEPTTIRRHVRTQSTHVRNASFDPPPRHDPPPRQLPHNPNTVWIRSAFGENGNLDGLPPADMSPCTASSLFPESPNELRSSMGFSMDPSTSYPRLPPLPPPLAPGTFGNPFPQPTIGTPLGEFMPAPGAATSSIRPITRSSEPAIKRPCSSTDRSPDVMEQDALLSEGTLAQPHLSSFRDKIAKRIKAQDRLPAPQSHLDAAGGIRAVSDALERATGLPALQLAQLPAHPPPPFQPITSQPDAAPPARNVTPSDARPPVAGDSTCRMMDSLFKN